MGIKDYLDYLERLPYEDRGLAFWHVLNQIVEHMAEDEERHGLAQLDLSTLRGFLEDEANGYGMDLEQYDG